MKTWADTPMEVTIIVVNLLMFPVIVATWLLGLIVGNFIRPFVRGFNS